MNDLVTVDRAELEQQQSAGALALHGGQTQWTADQHAALKQLGLADATEADLKVLMHQAQRTGLDPFSRQIYMIGRKDSQSNGVKYTIQTGIDGFRCIADRRPEYRGQVGPEWCGKDGVWRDVWLEDGPPVAARVGVIRADWPQPIYATAMFREYAQTKYNGGLTAMWQNKGALMIAKCAEALALRKAFPHDLSGLVTDDEAARDDLGRTEAPARGGVVDGQALTAGELTGGAPTPAAESAPAANGGARPCTRDQLNKLHAQLNDLDITERADKLTTVGLLAGRTLASSGDLTIAEASGVIDRVEGILADPNPQKALDAVLAEIEESEQDGGE